MAGDRPADPRLVAHRVLGRVEEGGAWADRAFAAEARRARLEGRDRALAARLAYGVVQRRRTLDHVVRAVAGRDPADLQPALRDVVRLGAYQLLFADRVPSHAAVSTAVTLARRVAGEHTTGLVNAVLRRVARDGPELFRGLDEAAPAAAALRHSYPDWLAELWWEAYGPDDARALLAAGNEPAEQALRVNRLRPGARERVERALDDAAVQRHGDPDLPDAVVLDDPFDVAASPLFRDGDVVPMSRAAQRVTALLDVQPGMRVLDACAAPGGKTGQLAVALEGRGRLVAVERDPSRARLLGETLARQGVEARLVQADAADLPAELGGFDAILLDAPCSGLGVVAGRPDLRWRRTPDTLAAARSTERALIEALLPRLAPGGRLLYAVCTLNPDEGRRLAAAYAPVRELETWPHRGDGDGFYAAVLEPG